MNPRHSVSLAAYRGWDAIRVPRLRWMNIEGICDAHHHIEERSIVHRLRDLRVGPPGVPQSLYLLVGDLVGVFGQRADKLQKQPLRRSDWGPVQIAISQRPGCITVLVTLQLQEPRMGA